MIKLALFAEYVSTLQWQPGCLDECCWRAALRAASLGINPGATVRVLCELVSRDGGTPRVEKIASQVERAVAYVRGTRAHTALQAERKADSLVLKRSKAVAIFRPGMLDALAARVEVKNVENLVRQKSPFYPDFINGSDFLSHLYQAEEKVLVFTLFRSQGQLVWTHSTDPCLLPSRGPEGVWYLINPVDGEEHPNPRQGGKLSRRSLEALTSFRFAVLESDKAGVEPWLKFLALAPLRIVAIYHSGGKSIHALIGLGARTKGEWDAEIGCAKPWLVKVGADPAALRPVQLSRLPQAWRGDKQQRLIYLNPDADGTPICEQPRLPEYARALQFIELTRRTGQKISPEEVTLLRTALTPMHHDPQVAEALAYLSTQTPS